MSEWKDWLKFKLKYCKLVGHSWSEVYVWFWIAQISQKHEIRIEELWRFPGRTATHIAPWFLASLDSVTSVTLLDGVKKKQFASKFIRFFFFLRNILGLLCLSTTHAVLSILCISMQYKEGLFLCMFPLGAALQTSFLEALFHLFLCNLMSVVLFYNLLSLNVHRRVFLETILWIWK